MNKLAGSGVDSAIVDERPKVKPAFPFAATLLGLLLIAQALSKSLAPAGGLGADDSHTPIGASWAEVFPIQLKGPINSTQAQISGLAWYEEWLVLLPQYPEHVGRAPIYAGIFLLHMDEIRAYLQGSDTEPLEPLLVPFDTGGIRERVRGYQGFEAIASAGERAYLTVESTDPETGSYLLLADMSDDPWGLVPLLERIIPIPSQSGLPNMGEESLLVHRGQVITLHEANGEGVNPRPKAHMSDPLLLGQITIPMVNIPYRITDATAVDKEDSFWVINYRYPAGLLLITDLDPHAPRAENGQPGLAPHGVERLIRLKIVDDRIVPSGDEPVRLRPSSTGWRNWEGIVRMPGGGFLLASDRHPETMLVYVPAPPD